jgi:hypothetical protein
MAHMYIISEFYKEGRYPYLYQFHIEDHRGLRHIIAIEAPDSFSASIELLNRGYTIINLISANYAL